MVKRICSIDGCEKPVVGRGWCSAHWYRWKTHGDPLGGGPARSFKAVDFDDGTRKCAKCGERKPLARFTQTNHGRLGRRSECKPCVSDEGKRRYARNRKLELERARLRREAKRLKIRSEDPARYQANLDELKRQERVRAAAQDALERVTARRKRLIRSRRRDAGLNKKNLRQQYGDYCFYCDVEMIFEATPAGQPFPPELATFEHVIPIALGGTHTWDNVVLACWTCNASKRHTPLGDWTPRHPRSA